MSVLIASASIDENGKAYGGKAGDQTGREVLIRTWYSGNWDQNIRPRSPIVADAIAHHAEQVCANNHVGYNQYKRNTLRVYDRAAGWDASKITTDCDTDCSAFATVCAEAAGIGVDMCYISGNAPVTSTIAAQLKKTGAFDVLTDKKYFTSDAYLRRGDILNRSSGHVVIVVTNGSRVSAAAVTVTPAVSVSALKVGDVVQFTGGKHYTSCNAANGASVGPGQAKVTCIKTGTAHPYHLIHIDGNSSVYGWVDVSTIGTASGGKTHTVAAGDTMWGISQRYGVNLYRLAEYNGMTINSLLLPGKELKIP